MNGLLRLSALAAQLAMTWQPCYDVATCNDATPSNDASTCNDMATCNDASKTRPVSLRGAEGDEAIHMPVNKQYK